MALLFGSTDGGFFVSSVVADEVYDPVFDTEMSASFIWNVLPSFYRDLMQDKQLFETVWSGMLQNSGADLLNLWQIDYAKSLTTVPRLGQRKWVEFDLYKDVDFIQDPGLTRFGIPGIFTYDPDAELLRGSPVNRARHDRDVVSLAGRVDERTSLAWSVEITVESCQTLGSVLFGYFPSALPRLRSSLAVGLLGDETAEDSPRPFIIHASTGTGGSAAVSSFFLTTGVEYRLEATYTASTGVCVLRVVELRSSKLTGSSGYTQDDLGSVFTNVFQDDSVNFDSEGIVAGDILVALGSEFEIISVDGSQLTVKPIGLAVSVDSISYEILGNVEVDSLSLDLPADSPDPDFIADQFGIASLDTRAITTSYVTSPGDARRKSMSLTTDRWRYLDPTVGEVIFSIPRLQDVVVDPDELLYEGTDFDIVIREGRTIEASTSTLRFQEPPLQTYWAEYVGYEESYIRNNFGANVGLEDFSSDQYKARVRGLYYAYFQGPTLDAIRTGVHILVGLPIAEEAGLVESINPAYSGTLGLITVSGTDYTYPNLVGTSLQVGDEVSLFEPLSEGVEVVDYLTSPRWFSEKLDFNEMEKYHSFQVNLNLDAFDASTLGLASTFVQQIKPTWKRALFLVFKNLSDDVEIVDDITVGVTLNLYDTPCEPPAVVAYDDAIYEGTEPDWFYDMGENDWDTTAPAMRATGSVLTGYVTLTNSSTTATGSSTTFLSVLGGPGAVTDRRLAVALYIESSGLETTAGSHIVTDASVDYEAAGRTVQVGDSIEIAGEGTFQVLTVDGPNQLTLDAPLTNTASGVSYEITGVYSTWSAVATVTSDTVLDFTSSYPGETGTYKVLLINNAYFEAYYDEFEEMCPDERLSFYMTLIPTYAGALPLLASLPDSQTTTVTVTYNAAGETKSSTLTEPTP
jgi:hypothetical protein